MNTYTLTEIELKKGRIVLTDFLCTHEGLHEVVLVLDGYSCIETLDPKDWSPKELKQIAVECENEPSSKKTIPLHRDDWGTAIRLIGHEADVQVAERWCKLQIN